MLRLPAEDARPTRVVRLVAALVLSLKLPLADDAISLAVSGDGGDSGH